MEVKKAVYSWSIRFREAVLDNERLLFLSEEYLEDLKDENVSPREFEYATRSVRKKCKFFPQMADILVAIVEYRKNPPPSKILQIEENVGLQAPPTPEQLEKNIRRINILTRISSGEITYEQGAKEMEEI